MNIGLSVCRADVLGAKPGPEQDKAETDGPRAGGRSQLLEDLVVQGGAVSPIITIIPR